MSQLKEEAATEVEEEDRKVDKNWPTGNVEVKDLEMRYRPGLELALRKLSATVHEGEKVGVVGRTGSGKSSLALAMFRMVE